MRAAARACKKLAPVASPVVPHAAKHLPFMAQVMKGATERAGL